MRQRQEACSGCLPAEAVVRPTKANIAAARDFVWHKWLERASETDRQPPTNLSGACKFASMFAQRVFGGTLRGNKHHQYVEHPEAGVIDLTDAAGVPHGIDAHAHDRIFWNNPDHRDAMRGGLAT